MHSTSPYVLFLVFSHNDVTFMFHKRQCSIASAQKGRLVHKWDGMAESGKKVAIVEPPRRKHTDDTSITEEQVTEMKGAASAPTAVTATSRGTAGGGWGGCLGSVMILFRKKPQKKVLEEDDREIDYDEIKDSLRFIGSGGQGAVYVGVHRGAPVAVKKVKEARDTDIAHLMRLKHPNIVQFRLEASGVTYVWGCADVCVHVWVGILEQRYTSYRETGDEAVLVWLCMFCL